MYYLTVSFWSGTVRIIFMIFLEYCVWINPKIKHVLWEQNKETREIVFRDWHYPITSTGVITNEL